jgi:hypothetical protein
MPFEGRQRAAVVDRCWSIYISLTRAFVLPEEFHVEFPASDRTMEPIDGYLAKSAGSWKRGDRTKTRWRALTNEPYRQLQYTVPGNFVSRPFRMSARTWVWLSIT